MNNIRPAGTNEGDPEGTLPEASRTFKTVQLRLLMKDREELFSRLVEIDFEIWVLEESFRVDDGTLNPVSTLGTAVPKRSLSCHGGIPRL